MKKLILPHQEPILFAKEVRSIIGNVAIIKVKFPTLPTLAMLVESAAQSSAAFSESNESEGFLVTLKNVKLLNKPEALEYEVKITFEYQLEALTYFNFEIIADSKIIAIGIFVIAIKNDKE